MASTSRRSSFAILVRDYATFNFGQSYFATCRCSTHQREAPLSISLGLWMTFLSYAISIPLGIKKAVKDGSRFDTGPRRSSSRLRHPELPVRDPSGRVVLRRFVLADISAARSRLGYLRLAWPARMLDYLWHITLPVTALVLGSFATSTLLTKNSFLEEIKKSYVQTARMKGSPSAACSTAMFSGTRC